MSLLTNLDETPLISVVIPVYNVEEYIKDCLTSVISQTYHNLEILLINDGSDDKTGSICDDYAIKDSRIKVFHNINNGVSRSRNIGVENAQGKYILFVDGDDVVDHRIVEFLYNLLNENNADISICGLQYFDNDISLKKDKKSITLLMNNIEALETMLYQKHFDTGPVAKLIRSDIVKNNLFPEGMVFEDLFTVYKYISEAERIIYSSEALYYYRQNAVSMMHKEFDYKIFDELTAIEEMEDYIKRNHSIILPAFYARKFSSYCQVLGWMPSDKNDAKISEYEKLIWDYLVFYRKEMFSNKKARLKNRYAALMSCLGKRIFKSLLIVKKKYENSSLFNHM